MQTRVAQAGPLVAPTTTKVGLSQTPSGAGALVLNGAVGAAVANNICLSQNGTLGVPLVINGKLAQTSYVAPTSGVTGATIGNPPNACPIYITSAGNDSALTWAIVGTAFAFQGTPIVIKETIRGTNASVSASVNQYDTIISITPSANTASTVTVGAMGFATLDTARQLLFTSGGTDTGVTITVSGTDWAGTPISETLTGGSSGSPVATVLDYLTVTSVTISAATASTISIGTNGVCGSPWINLDSWAQGGVTIQCVASGTVNYTFQVTNDDPDNYGNPIARSLVTWDASTTTIVNQTVSNTTSLNAATRWIRVLLNSQTNPGYVRLTVVQPSSVAY